MIYIVIFGSYLISKYYFKELMNYLMYGSLALIMMSAFILSIGGIESAAGFGEYAMFLFLLMFIDLSVTYFRK